MRLRLLKESDSCDCGIDARTESKPQDSMVAGALRGRTCAAPWFGLLDVVRGDGATKFQEACDL